MALLQISEPGGAPDPHQRRIAIGIDLGTTHSLVAAVRNGVAECLPDEHGRVILPSAVRYLADGKRQIGAAALAEAAIDPRNTLVSVKRFMGRGLADIVGRDKLPYDFVDAPGMVQMRTAAGSKSPVEVSAEILATLRFRAEDTFDDDVFGAVVTVPAYFDDAQRQATKDAAQLAGLNVLRLISEPTAAAIAYGLENGSEGLYAVYDLGGGTFDISLLRLTAGVFEVIATGGDSALGGDDFDAALAAWALTEAKLEAQTPQDKRAVLVAARAAKEKLSSTDHATLACPLARGELAVRVDRAQLDALAQPLLARTMAAVRKVLRDAKTEKSSVRGVVMVGGSTRMPMVQAAVGEFFGQPPLNNLNPDEVVALGAAIQGAALLDTSSEMLLLDVTPHSLGIMIKGGYFHRLIPQNSTVPTQASHIFTTVKDNQTSVKILVLQGENDRAEENELLGEFILTGLRRAKEGEVEIEVTFEISADGIVSVSAKDQETGLKQAITVTATSGLTEEELSAMVEQSRDYMVEAKQSEDLERHKQGAEKLIAEIEQLFPRVESAINGSDFGQDAVKKARGVIERAHRAVEAKDVQAIGESTEALTRTLNMFKGVVHKARVG